MTNDQIDIKVINLENKFLKRFESLSEFREQTLIRLNQEIENRTKAFKDIKKLENYCRIKASELQSAQDEIKALQIKDAEKNVEIQTLQKQISIIKNLLDQYFTMEINNIKESHAKRKM